MIVYPETKEHNLFMQKWIEKRLPDQVELGDASCLGVVLDSKLVCVVAYNNYRKTDIELNIAADNPRFLSRSNVAGLLAYPFIQLKVRRVSALVNKTNVRCRKMAKGMGFVEEGKLRHAGPNKEAMFLYGMTADDYFARYLSNGKHERRTATHG